MSKMLGSIKDSFDDGIRLIEVNADGDTVAISINDSTFVERFSDFLNWFGNYGKEMEAFDEEMKEKYPGYAKGETDLDAITEIAKKRTSVCLEARDRLDGLFGPGSCRKAFGVDIPDECCITEFVDPMVPFINMAFEERGQRISEKYNRNRKGARTPKSKQELIEEYRAEHGAEV